LSWNEIKEYTFLNLYFCISCRPDYSRRRWLRANLGSSRRSSWRPREHRWRSNWSSKPKFGKPWPYCPQPCARREAPDITNYFIYIAIYIYLYLFMHYVHRNCMRNPSCNSLRTSVLNISTWVQIAAMLIGPVEVGWFPITRTI
jgi:hypothetical protein